MLTSNTFDWARWCFEKIPAEIRTRVVWTTLIVSGRLTTQLKARWVNKGKNFKENRSLDQLPWPDWVKFFLPWAVFLEELTNHWANFGQILLTLGDFFQVYGRLFSEILGKICSNHLVTLSATKETENLLFASRCRFLWFRRCLPRRWSVDKHDDKTSSTSLLLLLSPSSTSLLTSSSCLRCCFCCCFSLSLNLGSYLPLSYIQTFWQLLLELL